MPQTPETPVIFSRTVLVADVPPTGLEIVLEPSETERAYLARHVGVLAMPRLVARLRIAPEAKEGLHVTGTLEATLRQTCVVTLEPFESGMKEAVDVHFAPAGVMPEIEEEGEGEETRDPPDEIVNGAIDLGTLVGEFLALGVDPYPRKPGAVFEAHQEGEEAASPFAALARLKDQQ